MIPLKSQLPDKAFINKFIAKKKFYNRAIKVTNLKLNFQKNIKRITWLYKLAENTIGISGTNNIKEIQIFLLELKKKKIPKKVITFIDKKVVYPILFILKYKDNLLYAIIFKDNHTKRFYLSKWNEKINFKFDGLNLENIYENIVKQFITKVDKKEKDFDEIVKIDDTIKELEREIEILENKIRREKQFNRKVELNKELQEKISKLENYKL